MKPLLIILILLISSKVQSEIVINELVADNGSSFMDRSGSYYDWIELYNSSDEEIDLKNYSISIDLNDIGEWVFPSIVIAPKSYLVVFASNIISSDQQDIHTNFKLPKEGGRLYLISPQLELIQRLDYPRLYEDQSYGCFPDGSKNYFPINNSTPNTTNNNWNHIISSISSGVYQDDQEMELNSINGDNIYFTVNGDTPTQNSNKYTSPIVLSSLKNESNKYSIIPTTPKKIEIDDDLWIEPQKKVDKLNIVRYASFNNEERTSDIYSRSIKINDELNLFDFPVFSIISDSTSLFGADSGIYVPGVSFDSSNYYLSGNYFQKGKSWERLSDVHYFENGEIVFQIKTYLSVSGDWSRARPQKSLKINTNPDLTYDNIYHKMFNDRDNVEFDKLVFRSTMNDLITRTMLKDVLGHEIINGFDIEYQENEIVHLFINGEYWGIQFLKEVVDEQYLSNKYDVSDESITILNTFQDYIWKRNDKYVELLDFIRYNDMKDYDNYNYVESQIDIDNFIDYHIAEMFMSNFNWPSSNTRVWRSSEGDSKWRYLYYDLDGAFDSPNSDMFKHLNNTDSTIEWPNPPLASLVYKQLMTNDNFRVNFVNRYEHHLNTTFNKERTLEILSDLVNQIKPFYQDHADRWGFENDSDEWEAEIEDNLFDFLDKRPCVIEEQLKEYFPELEIKYTCDKDTVSSLSFEEGLIKISPNPNDGILKLNNSFIKDITVNIKLFDDLGQLIFQKQNLILHPSINKIADLKIANGSYHLIFSINGHSEHHLLIIQ